MPATARTPRKAWIEAGLSALGEGGPDAIRVEVLASRLGVTKGGFYGFFATRDAFLGSVLDEWERRAIDAVLSRVEASHDDPRARMRFARMLTFSPELVPIDLAIRSWARRDATVAERLRRVDNARIDYLRQMFGTIVEDPDDIEARSTAAYAMAIGEHLMAADHPGRSRREALDLAVDRLLFDTNTDPP